MHGFSKTDEVEHIVEVWNKKFNLGEGIYFLRDFDFNCLFYPIDVEIDLPDSIFNKSKFEIKMNGIKYIVHQYDKDPFPSKPHAHIVHNNHKIDLATGNIYQRRRIVDRLTKKDFLKLREAAEEKYHSKLPPIGNIG